MKSIQIKFNKFAPILLLLILGFFISCNRKDDSEKINNEYTVAAYIWPSCHHDERFGDMLWPEGEGEWEVIKKGTPRFEGHYQPKVPLWGYESDDNPKVMEKWIDAATDHGVNVFIFDWYWYDGGPFLESALNDGFLKAKNNKKMKFYLMWANHDVQGNMWNHYQYKTDSLLWQGSIDWENFKIIVDKVINQYFKLPNYFKINGEPVFSIIDINNLVQSFNGIKGAQIALDYFRTRVKEAGFPGLHIQLIGHYNGGKPYLGEFTYKVNELIALLGAKSVTMYNMAGPSSRTGDYLQYGESGISLRNSWDSILTVPFFPCVSVGWDNTPRYPDKGKESIIYKNNTPENFGAYLERARDYADNHPGQAKLIIINAWNEWVEGSYLLPDMKYGFGYLEEVKKILDGDSSVQ